MRSIAIFGGTFDPVHNGHLQASLAIQEQFNFSHYYFLPCAAPVIKPATLATSQQRVAMLEIAIKNLKNFTVDLREIERDSPSYMVDTLESFRLDYENDSITLIMGYDAFLSLPKWYQWEKLIKLANLLVINRQQFANDPIPEAIKQLLNDHLTLNENDLTQSKAGVIYMFDAGHFDISSSLIREQLKHNQAITNDLPDPVYEYIKKLRLYQ